jgi:hypothetical protein
MKDSDKEWTLERLFEGRPEALELFKLVREYIESLGPAQLEVSKTQVSFGLKTKFAWVWLPQLWIKKRSNESITLAFAMSYRVQDSRIAEAVEPRPGRWTHHVLINSPEDFDEQVKE